MLFDGPLPEGYTLPIEAEGLEETPVLPLDLVPVGLDETPVPELGLVAEGLDEVPVP